MVEDEDGSFTVTYEDEDGTMRPVTMEEYIEHLETEPEEYEEGILYEEDLMLAD